MAEALLEAVVKKSLSLIQDEFATLSGLRKKVENLSRTLNRIKEVLEDAEEKQMTEPESPVNPWLQELKAAAYVLEDILEDCSSESLQQGCLSFFEPKNIMFRCRVGHKLKEMMERLDQIDQKKNRFGLREVVRERPREVAQWRLTSSNLASPRVYGREEDKKKVVEFLLSPAQSSDGSLTVYVIVGVGGVGKTTLAQTIFNDQRVSGYFPLRFWVCVSENFSRMAILGSIIGSVTGKQCDVPDLDGRERKVKELLQNKSYLLVLDDVWENSQKMKYGVNRYEWEKLESVLSCGSKNASILVSTRQKGVAEIMVGCNVHSLSSLSEKDCWALFKQYAFGPDKEELPELVEIGKEIAKKCGGSPLAAKALGCLVHPWNEKNEWLEVQESKLWKLPDENGILPALRLSYFHLMPTLKRCFAFCAIFPKDEEIMKQELIHLWMANGFISPGNKLVVEEVGNMVWNELYQKSFFQDFRADDSGVIYFKMHDLVHDLAESISKQECIYLEDINLIRSQGNIYHIGFSHGHGKPFNKEARDKFESLRTLIQGAQGDGISGWLPTSLRVLKTCFFKSSSLENLTHLRYLELRALTIETLPDSIYNLRKLEILKLIWLGELRHLPEHLTRLQKLRHLVIEDCRSLSRMFPNIRNLPHLRTLSVYIVKKEAGHSLAELRDLNLGGQLSIEGLGNVGSLSEAQEANLKGKEYLRQLIFSWYNGDETNSDATDDAQSLEALQPHKNLEVLTITRYKGSHWPSWMGTNLVLHKLVTLELYRCEVHQQLPPLGKLPSLKKLDIRWMEYLQYVDGDECYDGVEVSAFPSLESLILAGMKDLERLLKMETGGAFPRLSHLDVSSCPKLQLSFLPCVKNLRVWTVKNELLKSISCLSSLDSLTLYDIQDLTSLPEGMMDNLTNLKTLEISGFPRLKEFPYEITKLSALESLTLDGCKELESFPQGLEGLRSLRTLVIVLSRGLRSLPDWVQHLTSLEALTIIGCRALEERCEEGTGEDWHKIQHITKVTFHPYGDEDSDLTE